LLADLARQIGAAVHAVRLAQELQASRLRLVAAKEDERRRLRRDLHDGLGPTLAGLGLKLDTARLLVDDNPQGSKEVLSAVKDDIRTTINDIRRLVYQLRPPALDELGLLGALRECAGQLDTPDGLVLTVMAAEQLPSLPAAVEVAVYRIANEAMTNVVRHAAARHCDIRLRIGEDLYLSVIDDGAGLPADWRPGVGTQSMAERAEELGGQLTVSSGHGGHGTQVSAQLPLYTDPPTP
ncbi:MAG: sensor histidine kinase, partial [Pseudonocardiaceae bacterium]